MPGINYGTLASITSSGNTTFASGTTLPAVNTINVSGGTLNIAGATASNLTALTVSGGTLTGTGNITVSGGNTFDFTGGTVTGGLTLTTAATSTTNFNSTANLGASTTWNNYGEVIWGHFTGNDSSLNGTFNNQSGGVFRNVSINTTSDTLQGTGSFNNLAGAEFRQTLAGRGGSTRRVDRIFQSGSGGHCGPRG